MTAMSERREGPCFDPSCPCCRVHTTLERKYEERIEALGDQGRRGAWAGPFPRGERWTGIDLDGTLAYHETGYASKNFIGEPIESVRDFVLLLIERGTNVAIFTARVSVPEVADEALATIEAWCEEHLGTTLPVTCRKDYGMTVLYDDRAVQVVRNLGVFVEYP